MVICFAKFCIDYFEVYDGVVVDVLSKAYEKKNWPAPDKCKIIAILIGGNFIHFPTFAPFYKHNNSNMEIDGIHLAGMRYDFYEIVKSVTAFFFSLYLSLNLSLDLFLSIGHMSDIEPNQSWIIAPE